MADNCWVCTVEMHARRGAEITWIYPKRTRATRRAVFEAELPFACLGEASSRARDVRDAAATRFVVASGERRYFGCSASRTDCGDGAERGARQRAVAIVAATPVFDLLAEKVLVLASLPPDDDDTRASLRAAQASVAKEACGSRSVWKSKFTTRSHHSTEPDGRVIAENDLVKIPVHPTHWFFFHTVALRRLRRRVPVPRGREAPAAGGRRHRPRRRGQGRHRGACPRRRDVVWRRAPARAGVSGPHQVA